MSLKNILWFFLSLPMFLIFMNGVSGQSIQLDTLIGSMEGEVPNYFSVNQDQQVLIAGTHNDDFYQIIKTDLGGNILNSIVFGDEGDVTGWDVIQCPTGDIYFIGSRQFGVVEFFRFSHDLEFISKEEFVDTSVRAADLILSDGSMLMMLGAINGSFVRSMDYEANTIWEYTFSSEENSANDDLKYVTTRMVESELGNLIIAGQRIEIGSTGGDGFVYCLSADGELKWEYIYESETAVQFFSATELMNGDVLVAGAVTGEYNTSFASVSRFDLSGKLLSHELYQDEGENLIGIDVKAKNGLIYLLAASKGVSDIYLIITDMEGNQIEQFVYGNFRNDTALQFELLPDNKILIVARGVGEEPVVNEDIRFIILEEIAGLSSIDNQLINKALLVFPNPVLSGNVVFFKEQLEYVELYDVSGQRLMFLKDAMEFSTEGLMDGLYFLKGLARDGGRVYSQVIIVGE